jgi:hypothetical protein
MSDAVCLPQVRPVAEYTWNTCATQAGIEGAHLIGLCLGYPDLRYPDEPGVWSGGVRC